jgi:DNA polymerase-1
LFKNVDKIEKPKLKETLLKNKKLADLSKELVTIHCEVPLKEKAADLVCEKPDMEALRELFKEMEFNRSVNRVEEYAEKFGGGTFTLENQEEGGKKGKKEKTPKKEKVEPVEYKVRIVSEKYKALLTVDEIEKALAAAAKADWVTVDTETTGLDTLSVDIVGVSLCWKKEEAVYIPFNQQLSKDKLIKLLKPFLENPTVSNLRGWLSTLCLKAI